MTEEELKAATTEFLKLTSDIHNQADIDRLIDNLVSDPNKKELALLSIYFSKGTGQIASNLYFGSLVGFMFAEFLRRKELEKIRETMNV